jgi:SAM-dependent methyltransferase
MNDLLPVALADVASDSAAQDFWLDRLGVAHRFNAWVFSRFRRHLGRNVLEVGCGSGNFTTLIAADGRQVTGCDLHAPYVDIARARLAGYPQARVLCADATQAAFGDGYDTVVLLDVLEHIADDVGFLTRLRATLRPGGRIILKVPAYRWLYCGMDRAIGHYRRYDRASLRATLRAGGFEVVEQRYFNMFAVLGWFLNGKLLKRTTPPAEQLAAFERLVPLFRVFEAVMRVPFGISLIAVGEVK